VNKLVYFEHGNDVYAIIAREKQIKKWRREKKDKLVITMNPEWKDLSAEWGKYDFSPPAAVRNDSAANTQTLSFRRSEATEKS
jgi:hypothetical protein